MKIEIFNQQVCVCAASTNLICAGKLRRNVVEMDLLQKVERFIRQNGLLDAGDRVVMGISGGADSMCLLEMMCRLQNHYSLGLLAVHVNHGIRGETAAADERFVREECAKRCVECRVVSCDVPGLAAEAGWSMEEAGREARYRAFKEAAEKLGGAKIAVAHNKNDNAETFLFHAFRGAGIAGLQGILPRRGDIIRPLLCATREEIEEYLMDANVAYCTDETNLLLDYTRNRIRHSILGAAVEQVNSRAVEHLADAAGEIAGIVEFLRQQTLMAYNKVALMSKELDGQKILLSIKELEKLPKVLGDEVLLHALADLAGARKNIGRIHINQLRDIAQGATGRKASLPFRITACRSYDILELSRNSQGDITVEQPAVSWILPGDAAVKEAGKSPGLPGDAAVKEAGKSPGQPGDAVVKEAGKSPDLLWNASGQEAGKYPVLPEKTVRAEFPREIGTLPFELEFGGWILSFRQAVCEKNAEIPKNGYTKWFDYDKISNTLTLRTRRGGDYMVVHKDGRKKSLKSLFIDRKIPSRERDNILLLAAGSRVLWAVGVRSEDGLYVDGNTKRILVAELRKRG